MILSAHDNTIGCFGVKMAVTTPGVRHSNTSSGQSGLLPNTRMTSPLNPYIHSRRFSVSATASRLWDNNLSPRGNNSSPGPLPLQPNVNITSPVRHDNTRMRCHDDTTTTSSLQSAHSGNRPFPMKHAVAIRTNAQAVPKSETELAPAPARPADAANQRPVDQRVHVQLPGAVNGNNYQSMLEGHAHGRGQDHREAAAVCAGLQTPCWLSCCVWEWRLIFD